MKLCVNMLLECQPGEAEDDKPRTERLLWFDPSGVDLVTIDIFDRIALPVFRNRQSIEAAVASGQIKVLDADPYAFLMRLEEAIPLKHREYRDEVWKIISALVEDSTGRIFFSKERSALLKVVGERSGRTKMSLYKYLRRYWQGGQIKNALLPMFEKCGARGKERQSYASKRGRPSNLAQATHSVTGINVDASVKERFRRGIEEHLHSQTSGVPVLRDLYKKILEKYFVEGYEKTPDASLRPILPPADKLPTYEQFRYWYKKAYDVNQPSSKRKRQHQYNYDKYKILDKSAQFLFGPGSQYQIEITICDVLLVNSLNRSRVVGRPIIYTAIDVFSRLIVGISVDFEELCSSGILRVLENAAIDKVAFCKEYGIDIQEEDWSSCHLPEEVLLDQGILGGDLEHFLNPLGIKVSRASVYRTNWNDIIGRNFEISRDKFIQQLPSTNDLSDEQTDHDHKLDGVLDLHQFRKLMILSLLEHNQSCQMEWYQIDEFKVPNSIELYPIDLWNWGICNRAGHLRKMLPETLKLNLLPKGYASIAPQGIIFKGLFYSSKLISSDQWLEKTRKNGVLQFLVIFDPRKIDIVYLYLEEEQSIEPCYLVEAEKNFHGCDWHEIIDFFELQKPVIESATKRAQRFSEIANTQMHQIIAEAREQTFKALEAVEQKQSESEQLQPTEARQKHKGKQ